MGLTLRQKLQLLSALTVVGLGIIVTVVFVGLAMLNAQVNDFHRVADLAFNLTEIKASAISTIMLDPTQKETEGVFQDAEKSIADHRSAVAALIKDPATLVQFQTLMNQWEAYDRDSQGLITLAKTNAAKANKGLIPLYDREFKPLNSTLIALVEQQVKEKVRSSAEVDHTGAAVRLWVLVPILLVAIFLFASLTWFSRDLLARLAKLQEAASAIANGDLGYEIDQATDDELGALMAAFRHMATTLRAMIGQVRDAATTVAAGAGQISSSTEQLSQSTKAQAMASEQTSSAMEEMAASIQQVSSNAQSLAQNVEDTSGAIAEMAASIRQVAGNADTLSSSVNQTSGSINEMVASIQQVANNVSDANRAADQAAAAALGGQKAVTKTINGMNLINQAMGDVVSIIEVLGNSSSEIGSIVEVIDDIAEQTNLLALNAAIEAARAGDAGRGFAVVADEVRKLAERSAKATGEIASLIKGIQKETSQAVASTKQGSEAIQEGARLAQSAGESLEAIVGAVEQASRLMSDIAQATQEQTRAAEHISREVVHMSALTTQVSGATREQAKGSDQIINAVESMNQMTQQVSLATTEQRKGTDQAVRSVEDVNRTAQESANATGLIAQSAISLQEQATGLLQAIAFFKEAKVARSGGTGHGGELTIRSNPTAPGLADSKLLTAGRG
jgi:methyl-accepting chemotaxis protein